MLNLTVFIESWDGVRAAGLDLHPPDTFARRRMGFKIDAVTIVFSSTVLNRGPLDKEKRRSAKRSSEGAWENKITDPGRWSGRWPGHWPTRW